MYCLQPEEDPRISFLLIHDITEHGGALGDLANRLFDHCGQAGFVCSVFAIDLPGHGHTGMSAESGEFNMTSMVELVWEAADWIRTETKESAVFTIGLGIGGEVAFQVPTPLSRGTCSTTCDADGEHRAPRRAAAAKPSQARFPTGCCSLRS